MRGLFCMATEKYEELMCVMLSGSSQAGERPAQVRTCNDLLLSCVASMVSPVLSGVGSFDGFPSRETRIPAKEPSLVFEGVLKT